MSDRYCFNVRAEGLKFPVPGPVNATSFVEAHIDLCELMNEEYPRGWSLDSVRIGDTDYAPDELWTDGDYSEIARKL